MKKAPARRPASAPRRKKKPAPHASPVDPSRASGSNESLWVVRRLTPHRPIVTLALEWFLNPDHLPFVVAKEQGFFRDEGLDLPILGTMLEAAGLTHADIQPVDVGFALTDALLSGKADAVFGAFVNYEQVEAELKGASVEFASPTQYGVPDLYQLVVMTSDRMVKQHPHVVRGFTRALTRGLTFIHQRPDEALGTYLKANPIADPALPARTFGATLPFFPRELRQEPARWKAVHDWLHTRGVIKKKLPLKDLFTNAFVPKSKTGTK